MLDIESRARSARVRWAVFVCAVGSVGFVTSLFGVVVLAKTFAAQVGCAVALCVSAACVIVGALRCTLGRSQTVHDVV